MDRTLFSSEHRAFRDAVCRFLEEEAVPFIEKWDREGAVPREMWRKAGQLGFLCPWVEEAYGGVGADFLYSVIVIEETSRIRASGLTFGLHSDIVAPYIGNYGTEAQKKTWLPRCVTGEAILAVAMTEPGTGSDLAGIKTNAYCDGDEWVISGTKTFITNGNICDLVIVAARTDLNAEPAYNGLSLFIVEADRPGVSRGRKLEKMGLRSQDTGELAFDQVRVPGAQLLGEPGMGFFYLVQKLQQERLVCAIAAQAAAEACLAPTIAYCKQRVAFGKPISAFQNTKFQLAEVATELELGRTFVDRLIQAHTLGQEIESETSMAKWWVTEMLNRVADKCLQLHGGYGYMMEYDICKRYMDARVFPIFAGSNEIMKVIISKRMGL